MKLYLIGLPGSGKSFLGKKLADEAGIPFIDLDLVIEQDTGSSISDIFSEKGEAYFRNLEAVALRQQSKAPDFVMACGGGTPCFHDNMKFIHSSGKSIFLNTPIPQIVARLNAMEKRTRPLLAGVESISLEMNLSELLKQRVAYYRQATFTIEDSQSADLLERIIKS